MNKPQLSIIIPFAGEYPQVLFTIQSIAESLHGKIDFEIIAINNMCQELILQWENVRERASGILNKINANGASHHSVTPITGNDINEIVDMLSVMKGKDKSGEAIKASAGGNPWLRYMEFDGRLSHWECKRLACKEAKADTFLFIDAHCVPSGNIAEMYKAYEMYDTLGTFHMPITYKILEWRRLIYKMVIEKGFYGYSFTSFPEAKDCDNKMVEVPCMSTCGMMISRWIYDRVGGWPKHFAAYGGGENFMNYALAVTGHSKCIYPGVTCHHHGESRDYHYTFDGTLWNRLVAHYLFGGADCLNDLRNHSRGNPAVLNEMVSAILENPAYQSHRQLIKSNTTISLDDWRKQWEIDQT